MQIWTEALPFFTKGQLACKGTGIVKIDIRFAVKLPALRLAWGKPLTPSSVCRTPNHNKNEGGHPNSLHLTDNPKHPSWGTMAADIRWIDWGKEERIRFCKLAYSMGFSVGLHNSFCHIDLRKELGLPQAVFVYGTWSNQFSSKEII